MRVIKLGTTDEFALTKALLLKISILLTRRYIESRMRVSQKIYLFDKGAVYPLYVAMGKRSW